MPFTKDGRFVPPDGWGKTADDINSAGGVGDKSYGPPSSAPASKPAPAANINPSGGVGNKSYGPSVPADHKFLDLNSFLHPEESPGFQEVLHPQSEPTGQIEPHVDNRSILQKAKDALVSTFSPNGDIHDKIRAGANELGTGIEKSLFLDKLINAADKTGGFKEAAENIHKDDLQQIPSGVAKGLDYAGQAIGLLGGGVATDAIKAPAAISNLIPALNETKTATGALKATLPAAEKTAADQAGSLAAKAGLIGAGEQFVRGESTPNMPNRSLPAEAGASFRTGMGDVVNSAGYIAKLLHNENLSKDLIQKSKDMNKGFETDAVPFSPGALLNPHFYATTVSRSLPSTLALLPTALFGDVAGGAVAAAVGAKALYSTIIKAVLSSAVATPLESLMEGAQTYQQMLDSNNSDSTSRNAAWKDIKRNMLLLGITNTAEFADAFMPKGASRIFNKAGLDTTAGKVVSTAVQEGAEEGIQQWIQNSSTGQKTSLNDPSMQEQIAIGALFGSAFGGIGAIHAGEHPVEDFYSEVKSKMPAQAQTDLDKMVQQQVMSGVPEKDAQVKVMDTMAQQPEGQDVIQQTVKDMVNEHHTSLVDESNGTNQTPENSVGASRAESSAITPPAQETPKIDNTTSVKQPESKNLMIDFNNKYLYDPNNSHEDNAKLAEAFQQMMDEIPSAQKASEILGYDGVKAQEPAQPSEQPKVAPPAAQKEESKVKTEQPAAVDKPSNSSEIVEGSVVTLKGKGNQKFTVTSVKPRGFFDLKSENGGIISSVHKNAMIPVETNSAVQDTPKEDYKNNPEWKALGEGITQAIRDENYTKAEELQEKQFILQDKLGGPPRPSSTRTHSKKEEMLKNLSEFFGEADGGNKTAKVVPNEDMQNISENGTLELTKPTFIKGNKVAWTDKSGKALTGTVKSIDTRDNYATIDTDQITKAGGVPIGRIEIVPLSMLSHNQNKSTSNVSESNAIVDQKEGNSASGNATKPKETIVSDETKTNPPVNVLNDHHARMNERAEAARQRIKAKYGSGGNTLSSGLPPDLIADLSIIGYTKILDGVTDLKSWSAEMMKEASTIISNSERIRKWLPSIYAMSQQIADSENPDTMIDEILSDAFGEVQKEVKPSGQTNPVRNDGRSTLEGISSEDVQGTQGGGETGTSPVRGAGVDEGRNVQPDIKRGNEASGGVGERQGNVDTAAGRGNSSETGSEPGKLAGPGTGRSLNTQGSNYTITEADDLGLKGKKTSFKDNVKAIKLMKEIVAEARVATAEEQKELVKYVGWGGIAEPFSPSFRVPQEWKAEHQELKELLTEQEWQKAADTILNAHYTSKDVIQAMYDGLQHLGFDSGRVLEPSMGIGHFIGLLPHDLHARITGVEIDPITGNIAKLLYPKSDVRIMGFEEAKMADNFYDVAIGNVPFGDYGIADPHYKNTGMTGSIHNYFFAKALDKVRPGGLVMFITSKFTMDSKNSKVRKYISNKADLVGAIRLPNNAFKKNAGTEVVADILIFKKREDGTLAKNTDWTGTEALRVDGGNYDVNAYFVAHPEMIMGKFSGKGSMYGGNELTVTSNGTDLKTSITNAIKSLPGNVITKVEKKSTENAQPRELIQAPGHIKENAYVVQNDEVFIKQNDLLEPTGITGKAAERIKGMVGIRNVVRDYLRLQLEDKTTDSVLVAARKRLNQVYDDFVKKFGFLNDQVNTRVFSEDPDAYLLQSMESYDKDTKTATKAAIFKERTVQRYTPAIKAGNAKEALMISLNEKGYIDLARMSELTNKSESEIIQDLQGNIYNDPQRGWVTDDEYLSGNVKEKLAAAQNAALLDPAFQENVASLEKVQPADLSQEEIDIKFGSHWLPKEYVQQFVAHIAGTGPQSFIVSYNNQLAQWVVEYKDNYTKANIRGSVQVTVKWGTSDYDAVELMEMALNMNTPVVVRVVKNADGPDSKFTDKKATVAVREKQNNIKEEFQRWIWSDKTRADALLRMYNDRFNTDRLRNFEGEHLTFPGMNPGITLKSHQKSAVWRAMQKGNTLLAHAVGAGKTYEMIAAMVELKRTGIINKPMWVVPNHLVEQMGADFMKLYPAANILVAGKKDFEKNNRKRLFAKITTGNYDAVIVPHSSFGKISMSREAIETFYGEQLQQLELAMEQEVASGQRKDSGLAKKLRSARKSLKEKMDKQLQKIEKDDNVTFEELGVDGITVDEAHEFKNLFYGTKLNRVAGLGNPDGSGKAFDLFMKVRYLQQLNGGRGIIFATGTPVSNSLAEMYTFQRYLQYDEMKKRGILSFDSWVSQFGEIKNVLELSPEGKGLRMRTRLNEVVNLPELLHMFRDFADVKTADELLKKGLISRPDMRDGKRIPIVVPATDELRSFVQSLADRAEAIRAGKVKPDEDNMLAVVGDGRKAALDMRLIDPNASENRESKVFIAADHIAEIYKRTKKYKTQDGKKTIENGTQLVFLDLSTPKGEKVDSEGNTIQNDEMEQENISVYDELRKLMIKKGIPLKEIAFIHDYPKDAQKEELFRKVNNGEIRVLMGSTAKMGAGMNVQTRLKALHHLDVPWRPSDIEQREGRVLRQGNENDEVEIYAYMTEESFDAYMWQTIANKAKVVDQTMSGDLKTRRVTDPSGMEMSANELKALATGDVRIMELANLDKDVAESDLKMQNSIDSLKEIRREMAYAPAHIKDQEGKLAKYISDQKQRIDTRGDKFVIEIQGSKFTDRKEAGAKLMDLESKLKVKPDEVIELGSFAGFPLEAGSIKNNITKNDETYLYLKGSFTYNIHVSETELGTIRSLENTISRIDDAVLATQQNIDKSNSELSKLQEEVTHLEDNLKKQRTEYNEKLSRKMELEQEMNLDRNTDEAIPENVGSEDSHGDFAFSTNSASRAKQTSKKESQGETEAENKTDPIFDVASVAHLTPLVTKRVAKLIANFLGTSLRDITGKVRAEGVFSQKSMTGSVRKRSFYEWRVVGHELGHAFSFTYGNPVGVQSELKGLAATTYPGKIPKGREVEEGFAEFFFMYVADPEKVRNLVPQTTALFEDFVSNHKDLSAMMAKVRTIVDNHFAGTALERGLGAIVSNIETNNGEVHGEEYRVPTINRGVFNHVDSTLPAGDMMKDLENVPKGMVNFRQLLSVAGDAKAKALMSFTHRAKDQKGSYVNDGILKDMFQEGINLIGEVIQWKKVKVKSIDKKLGALEIFSLIALSNRVKERYGRGFELLPLTLEEADAILEQTKKIFPKSVFDLAEKYAETLSDIILEKLTRADVITDEVAAKIRAGSNDYYPFYYDSSGFYPASGKIKQGATNKNPAKRFRGKKAAVLNLFQATMMKLAEVEQAIEYKKALDTLQTIIQQEGMGKYGTIMPAPPKVVNVDMEQVMSSISDLLDDGIDVEDININDRMVRVFMPGGFDTVNAKNVVMNTRDGKPTFMTLAPDVFSMLMSMRPIQIEGFAKLLAWSSRITRYTFLAQLGYMKNVLTRDLAGAMMQTANNPFVLLRHYHAGISATLGIDDETYATYVSSGGFSGAAENVMQSMTRSQYDEGIFKIGSSGWGTVQAGAKKSFVRVIRTPGEALRVLEEYKRIAEFIATWKRNVKNMGFDGNEMWDIYKKEGTDELPPELQREMERILIESAYNSREIEANYGLSGIKEWSKKYQQTVPFMKGSIQGTYRAARLVKNNPKRFIIGVGALSLISVLAWALMNANEDDKKYFADMDSGARDRYWWIPVPGTGMYIALAKPYEYGLAANFLERYMDHLWANVKDARKPLEDWKSAVTESVSIPWLPQIISVWSQLQSNTSDFGSPIVPQADQYVAKDMQYGPNTSNTAKGITGVINEAARFFSGAVDDPTKGVSARQVEYFINGITGKYGTGVLKGIDWTTALMQGKSAKQTQGIEYAPVIGSVFYSQAEGTSRIVNKFYENYNKTQTISQTTGRMMTAGNTKLPAFATNDNVNLLRYLPAMRAISLEMSSMRKEYDSLEAEADPTQRRKLIMQQDFAEKLAAGLMYGVEPETPNMDSGITDQQIQMLSDRFTAAAQKALVNEAKTKEGATEQAAYLLQLMSNDK